MMKRFLRHKKISTIIVVSLIILTLTLVTHVWAGQDQSIELPVTEMTCAACGFAVKTVLKRLDGVNEVKVSYKKKIAVVIYDPQQVTPKEMAKAVNDTGNFGIDLQEVENRP